MDPSSAYAVFKPFMGAARVAIGALNKAWRAISWRLLKPHYEYATRLFIRRCCRGIWHPLTTSLEYSVHFADLLSAEFGDRSYIRFRLKSGSTVPVTSVSLRISATQQEITRQIQVDVGDIGIDIVEFPLTQLPILEIYPVGEYFAQTISSYRLKILETQPATEVDDAGLGLEFHPICRYINEHCVRRNGVVYNLTHFVEAQREFAAVIRYVLLRPGEHYVSWRGIVWWTPRELVAALLSAKYVITPLFWALVVARFMSVDQDARVISRLRWITANRVRAALQSDRPHWTGIRRPRASLAARRILKAIQNTGGSSP